ncbi:MAG: alpha/beta fold hydrolase [Deltaproteobacteria bacterium]|nr:alpha/beta fold hydrolase [Deltaproteobacteria bacterium]
MQTIYANYVRKVPLLAYQRENVVTPDGDFLHLDWVLNSGKRLVILTHGIAGDSQCSYMRGMGQAFLQKGWSVLAWNMRGRGSDTPNVKKENYHMGFTHDLRFVVDHVIQEKSFSEVVIIGFSMGGNILLKYLGEEGSCAPAALRASIAISAPIDLVSCGIHMDLAANRLYSAKLLKELLAILDRKHSLLASHINVSSLREVKTWKEFDETYTVPLYGFRDFEDYRQKASSKPLLAKLGVPSLLLNAYDDPMLTAECFPTSIVNQNPHLFGEFPENGGHIGFVSFQNNGLLWSEERAVEFVEKL